jgi:hypothetical protein
VYATEWDNYIMASNVVSSAYLPNNIRTGASSANEVQVIPFNPYIGYASDVPNKQVRGVALCSASDVSVYSACHNSGWVANGNRFTTNYAYLASVDRWPSTNRQVANRPADLAENSCPARVSDLDVRMAMMPSPFQPRRLSIGRSADSPCVVMSHLPFLLPPAWTPAGGLLAPS